MNAAWYAAVTVVWAVAWLLLVWFRRRIPYAQGLLVVATLSLLLWLSGGFDWGVFNEQPFDLPPPDRSWNIAEHTNLLNNQTTRDTWTFRDREVRRNKAPGTLRIVALGSSSTFGTGLYPWEDPYTRVLERRLADRAEVINAGFTGYHSFQVMLLLTQVVVEMSPDVVLFYYGKNEGTGNETKRYHARAARIKQEAGCQTTACLSWAISHGTANPALLRLGAFLEGLGGYRWLRNLVMRYRSLYPAGIEPTPHDRELPPDSREILRTMTATAATRGFRLVLIPELSREGGAVNGDYARLMAEAADGRQVVFLDLGAAFGRHRELFQDEIHPTAAGHQRLGEVLADALAARGVLPPT